MRNHHELNAKHIEVMIKILFFTYGVSGFKNSRGVKVFLNKFMMPAAIIKYIYLFGDYYKNLQMNTSYVKFFSSPTATVIY